MNDSLEMIDSPFLRARRSYAPRFPQVLDNVACLKVNEGDRVAPDAAQSQIEELQKLFLRTGGQPIVDFTLDSGSKEDLSPVNVGVVLSGGQAPGGHNVICGLYDAIRAANPESKVIGFRGGPAGILKQSWFELDDSYVDHFRNTGGFHMLGSGRTKIESDEDFTKCLSVLKHLQVNVLVVIGGDDSNTNAALLAEYFAKAETDIRVVGVPKTIDGDLKNKWVETSFGFDTAVRLYSELIANISRDALSAKKYYHFIRLMGRAASHITLEAALQTQPNLVLLSEEVERDQLTLREIVENIGDMIKRRADDGKNYGVVLVPEGLIEFIPEIRTLIADINRILAEHHDYFQSLSGFTEQSEYVNRKLSKNSSYTFSSLPFAIQRQLLMDRDPHGNVQVSRIETEKLLIEMLEDYLDEESAEGRYKGKFGHQQHFLGYEGRCAAPTNFDADYAFSLGRTAAALSYSGLTGYMAVVRNLASDRDSWTAHGVPLFSMMNIEERHGKPKPVIKKSLVNLSGPAFGRFDGLRSEWTTSDHYRFTGPIQYFGPAAMTDLAPCSLTLEQKSEQPW